MFCIFYGTLFVLKYGRAKNFSFLLRIQNKSVYLRLKNIIAEAEKLMSRQVIKGCARHVLGIIK
jgi:hypothetical protein